MTLFEKFIKLRLTEV